MELCRVAVDHMRCRLDRTSINPDGTWVKVRSPWLKNNNMEYFGITKLPTCNRFSIGSNASKHSDHLKTFRNIRQCLVVMKQKWVFLFARSVANQISQNWVDQQACQLLYSEFSPAKELGGIIKVEVESDCKKSKPEVKSESSTNLSLITWFMGSTACPRAEELVS